MSITFRELVEALNRRKDEDNEEARALMPLADGEKDFAAMQGYPPKIGGPNDKPYPAKGADDALNARWEKTTDKHNPPIEGGEKKPIKQGSSDITQPPTSKGQSNTRANAGAVKGDTKPLRLSPSAVKTVEKPWENTPEADLKSISEDVTSQLVMIANGKGNQIKFADGEMAKVNAQSAKNILNTMTKLNPENAKKFKAAINSGAEGFLKMMQFAGGKS